MNNSLKKYLFTLIIDEKVSAMPNLNRVGNNKSKLASLLLSPAAITDFVKSCNVGIDL